ncbi:MAG: hypothetical protein IPJ14_13775 [Kineosporiaceae bacterium]|nr:hypothetical protein [Kineosporiaceae bacterium]MBK7623692.1 hypothetical protein [Kineosporiaceae bacterium]MBK8078037.1 hypothetical protein [Kineosporiaceae bacterium]
MTIETVSGQKLRPEGNDDLGNGHGLDLRARVELAMSRLFLAVRVPTLIVAVASLASEYRHLDSRGLATVCVVVSLVENLALTVLIVRRRRLDQWWLLALDACVQAALMVASHLATTSTDRYRIRGWFQPMAVNVVAALPLARSVVLVVVGTTLLAATLTAVALQPDTSLAWLVQNPGGLGGLAVAGWFVIRFVRQIALEAEHAHDQAVRASAELEKARARDLVHDPAGTLERLADLAQGVGLQLQHLLQASTPPATSAEAAQSETGLVLCRRLQDEVVRARHSASDFRTFLQGRARAVGDLEDVLVRLRDQFPDLPIHLVLGELHGAMESRVLIAIESAVRTVFANTLRYAGRGTPVDVFAEVGPGQWTVRVTDRGPGFDPRRTSYGHGLSAQVVQAIRQVGGQVVIDAVPRQGVSVELSGPPSGGPPSS